MLWHLVFSSLVIGCCACIMLTLLFISFFFFFNDTATTEIYTLSLHDALPISPTRRSRSPDPPRCGRPRARAGVHTEADRKSTRLNSSHTVISYAVFCLKKKKKTKKTTNKYKNTTIKYDDTTRDKSQQMK